MAFVGNLLWFILGGLFACLGWFLLGLLLCLTIVGIPFGIAAFRIAGFAAFPFGRELVDVRLLGEQRVAGTSFANILWVILAGFWLAIAHVVAGIVCLLSFFLVFPVFFGIAHFKLAGVCFAPLGKKPVRKEVAEEARRRGAIAELERRVKNQNVDSDLRGLPQPWPQPLRKSSYVPILGIIVGLELLGLIFVVVAPSLGSAREIANRAVASAQARSIHQACYAYGSSNGGKFPPDLGTLIKARALEPRDVINPRLDSSKKPPAGATLDERAIWVNQNSDFVYRTGKSQDSAPDDIIVYERITPQIAEGINICYGDGSVYFVDMAKALEQLRKVGEMP